jgi:TP901 family phage tail tape measure protein
MNKVMSDGATQLINWGKNTQWAGRQLTVGLTVPLAAFGMAAQKAFRDADAELVRLTKVYGGLSATSATELAKVRKDVSDTAREIAGSYGIAYKDTIALAADLAATGQQGNDLLLSTKETSRLAVLGEVDRQEAMKATLAIQNAFKQNTDELSESINFLNAVENQTSTSLADLVEAIPKAGPVIQSLGGDVQDLALYLTAMKEGGVNASEGANAIKSAMASLINPTKVAKEMFTGFGINIDQIVTSNAGNLTATIVELQGALDNLDPLSKSRAIEQLFGKFQYARMSALFENMGKEGSQTLQVMDLMKASAADLAGIADRELGMVTESASGKFKRALASVQADLAVVGDQFLRISTKILQVVDGIIKFFQKLPAPVKSFLTALGGLTAVAGPLIMLAGVMGNFIGYVIKGIFHLRQLVKGGQGFKLLTPEIIAADAAAKGLASTFYSDTEATVVLTNAVNALTNSFALLETKAASAAVKVQPGISTVAGTVLAAGGYAPRVVDKNNPLVGAPYSRDMSHLTPSGTPQMGTIFGTVPGSGPVNVRIGKNPQTYMDSDLPKIPGVTSVNGISTGIVSQEAAKWHAMTAAIAMQSEAELKLLKAEVMSTGTVTSSLSDSYQALLPQFTEITSLAAQETAAIVQQLQQSKITVDQARAKILQLNATVEAMLAETATLTATGMGRTVNLTTVPLTTQPVVDPTTGKSNMKEMFHKGSVKEMADRIARALGGVRTSGAGYNIETTKPKFAKGGIVPGTGNTDTYHTTAEPGAFVINKASTEANMPIIENILGGTPIFRNAGGQVPVVLTPGEAVIPASFAQSNMSLMHELNGGPGNTSGMGRIRGGALFTQRAAQGRKSFNAVAKFFKSSNYEQSHRSRQILNDAWALHSIYGKSAKRPNGMSRKEIIDIAERMDEEAFTAAHVGGKFSQSEYDSISQEQLVTWEETLRQQYPDIELVDRRGPSRTRKNQSYGAPDVAERKLILDEMLGDPRFDAETLSKIDPGHLGFDRAHTKPRDSWDTAGRYYLRNAIITDVTPNYASRQLEIYGVGRDLIPRKFSGALDLNAEDIINERARILGFRDIDDYFSFVEQSRIGKVVKIPERFTQFLRAYGMSDPAQFKAILSQSGFAANMGGKVPGQFAQKLFGGGKTMFLGMPKTIKQVEAQRAAKIAMEKASEAAKNSRYGKEEPIQYGDVLEPTSGRSFPVPGIGGVYSRNGERVFVKPMLDEKAALAEMRATEIARSVHGLHAPKQKIVVMKDPTDPTGKRNLLALESKYDKTFAEQDGKFTTDQYFRQLVASALRGDKDLGRGNLSGNTLADVGTAGVFSTASGLRDYSATMPSFKHQAMVNLLGVKGSSAKKFFAEATSDIPKGMTADQYNDRMLKEINEALPKLKETVARFPDLTTEEKVIYDAMIERLSDARRKTYQDLHGVHSSVTMSPEKTMTPAAIAKMLAADELKRRQKGQAVSLSDNAFKTPENGFMAGGLIGAITKGKALHRVGAGFGKDSTGGWGVTSLEIGMAEKLFASTGLTKRTQRILYDKLAASLAKEMPYGYTKNAQGHLIKALEPDIMDTVIKSAASDALSDPLGRKVLSQIDREILRKKFANWDSKKDTSITDALKQLIFKLEGREKGGPVNSGQAYIVGEKGPEIFVPRNSGGIIPNTSISAPPQGLVLGGGVLAQTAIPAGAAIGAQLIAQKVANPIAQLIIQQIGFILPMIMMNSMMMNKMQGGAKTGGIMSKIPASMTTPVGVVSSKTGGLTKYGAGLDKMANSGKTLPTMLSKIGFAATRLNIGLAVLATAVMVGKNRFDAYKESMRLNALGFGMTAEGAEKAGLKFTDYNKKIKDAISDAKALRETNRLLFESRANSGTALNITVAEFKKLKKESKELFGDQIALINKTSADDQADLAIRLKQQFIAMGMSAEEATKKIYAMYSVSKFASSAAEYTVASKGFNSIKTSIDAAVGALRTFNSAVEDELDPTEQANAFNTALLATEAAIKEAEDKAMKAREKEGAQGKKLKFISQSEREDISFAAEQEALNKITSTVGSQVELGEELVEELKNQNPELDKLVNKYDTNLSVFQKLRIVAKGFTGDLSKLNAAQTNAVYQLQSSISNAVANENRSGMLKKQYEQVDSLRKLQDKYEKAAKGQKVSQQISDREKLSALQKQIDANNKLADARIKALTAAKEENDLGREIAKKKAEYDAALATGDTAGAQIIGMDIQGLESQLQFNSQVKAIEQSRDQANAPLIRQIEAMQKKQQALADAAALAGEKLGDVSKAIDKQESAIDKLNSSMTDYRLQLQIHKDDLAKWKDSPEAQALLTSIAAAAEAAKVDLQGLGIDKNAAGKYDAKAGQQLFDKIAGGLETSLLKDGLIVNGDLIVNGKKIDIGGAASSKAALADPTKVAGKTTGEGRDKKYFDDAGNVVTEKEYKSMPVGAPSDGKEYVVPLLGLNDREFINRDSARREFFKSNNNKGQFDTEDGFRFMASGAVTKNGKTVGSWLAALPGSTKVKSYYTGSIGAVRGEGTATSDSIPAYLSNGEYVVRASAVSQYGVPFLDALNAEKLYTGGEVGNSIPKFGFGGWVKSGFKKMPQIAGSSAIWQAMEEIEKLLSLKYGADKKDSGLEKWSKAFGRLAFNTAQGGVSGLTFGGIGGLAGVGAGLVEGIIGLAKDGSQYGVKGGTQSGVKGFSAKTELNNMSVLGSLGKVAETAGLSVPFGFAGNKIAPKISAMINKFKTKPGSSMPVSESVQAGTDTYNTFSIGKDKFAFKGLESSSKGRYGSVVDSDISALTNVDGSLSVVPTTPQGLIQAALKLKPNDKALMDLLDGFKSKKYGDSETDLLDLMIASSYIDQDGKLLSDINTEGLALVISHLAGDKNATTILKSKKTVLDSLLAKEKSGATTSSNPSRFEHPLEPDQVPVIHSTKHGLSYDPSGNIEIRPAGYYRVGEGQLPKGAGDIDTAAVARPTIHTALYGTVADHIYSQWDTANKKIVSTLGAMIGANGNPQSLNPIDTWWSRSPGESLLFPKDKTAIISPFTNEADYVKELIKRGIIKQGEPHPIVVSDPNSNEILQLSKSQYSNSELEEIAELVYKEAAQKVIVKDGQLVTESRSLGETLYHKMAEPAEYLDRVALQLAKQKLNIEGGPVYVDGWGLSSPYANKHVAAIADSIKVPQLQHSQSAQQTAESAEYFNTVLRERGDYEYSDPINIDSLRYLALSGHYPTPKTTAKKPSFDDDDFDIWDDDIIRGATGGFLKGGKIRIPGFAGGAYVNPTYSANMSIPTFDSGINMVPADMLAMIHKNEAVVPANMNPFNPNANNATMGGATFNITNNINGFDGDINQLSRMVTQQTVSAIKSLDGRTASMSGPNMNVGINA